MFCKLAARNVRRSLGDYSVYFLTLALGVCVFYAFNAMEGQSVMTFLAQKQLGMVEAIMTLIEVFSVFVSVILAGLMLYANTFMMKRRKKELATYFLLGLPGGKVALLLWLETLLIGLLALGAGLGLGILFSHGLSLLAGEMFQVNVDFLKVNLSVGAMVKTAVCFGILFLLVMVFNALSVSRCRLIDLLNAGKRHEEMKAQPLGRSVALFLVGVVLLVVAYAMLLVRGMLAVDALFFVMLGLGSLGTLLFFRSLSGFLLRVCQSNQRFYYKGLNMFVLRQFNARIHTTYLSMTAVCLMLLLAMGITASSAGLHNTITALTNEPCDVTLVNYAPEAGEVDFPQQLGEFGFDPEREFSFYHQFTLYYATPELWEALGVNGAVKLSDYNTLMAQYGRPALTLEGGRPVVSEEKLAAGNLFVQYAVVPDGDLEGAPPRRQLLAASYAGDPEETEARMESVIWTEEFCGELSLGMDSKLISYMDMLGSKVLVIYLGLYLGIIFLLASAAVLALQQLSQAADNAKRYAVLSRLGVDRAMADRSVFTQVALAFFLPLSLAVVHSVVGMRSANQVIAQVGKVDAWGSTLVTAGLLLGVYGAYFLATFLGARRMARG